MQRLNVTILSTVLFFFPLSAPAAVSPESVAGATTVDGPAAKRLFDRETIFIDVRSANDWAAGRIPGAIHIELTKEFSEESLANRVQPDDEVVIYCNGSKCMRSSNACAKAVAWGYKNIYYYRDGFPDWKSRGYPVE